MDITVILLYIPVVFNEFLHVFFVFSPLSLLFHLFGFLLLSELRIAQESEEEEMIDMKEKLVIQRKKKRLTTKMMRETLMTMKAMT